MKLLDKTQQYSVHGGNPLLVAIGVGIATNAIYAGAKRVYEYQKSKGKSCPAGKTLTRRGCR